MMLREASFAKRFATWGDLLHWGQKELEGLGEIEAQASTEWLLQEISGLDRSRLYLDTKKVVPAARLKVFKKLIALRKKRVPAAYLLQKSYFWNEELRVGRGCLIPRPETEVLVERFIERSGFSKSDRFRFIDLGSGTGAIGIALLRHFQKAAGTFVDISRKAVKTTRDNLSSYRLLDRAEVLESDLFQKLESPSHFLKYEAIVSNPPYLAKEDWYDLEPEIFFEPRRALDGKKDGLYFYRSIVREAFNFLTPGGILMMEMGKGQAEQVKDLLEKTFFTKIEIFKDHAGLDRVIMGRRV